MEQPRPCSVLCIFRLLQSARRELGIPEFLLQDACLTFLLLKGFLGFQTSGCLPFVFQKPHLSVFIVQVLLKQQEFRHQESDKFPYISIGKTYLLQLVPEKLPLSS